MNYAEHVPPLKLQPFVECLWTLVGISQSGQSECQRILPDGCMELIFHRGEPFRRFHQVQPRSFIVGQMTAPVFVQASSRTEVLGIRFHPGGAYPFLAIPMRELAGQFVSICEIWNAFAAELEERVLTAPSLTGAIQIALAGLQRLLKPVPLESVRIRNLTALQIRRHGALSTRELADLAGIGERQLEREFNEVVGLTPKMFARILRFHSVFQSMESSSRWVDIAFDCGYYDQSHLIADFRQFAGTTPTSLDLDRFELGRHFLRAGRMSDFSKTAS